MGHVAQGLCRPGAFVWAASWVDMGQACVGLLPAAVPTGKRPSPSVLQLGLQLLLPSTDLTALSFHDQIQATLDRPTCHSLVGSQNGQQVREERHLNEVWAQNDGKRDHLGRPLVEGKGPACGWEPVAQKREQVQMAAWVSGPRTTQSDRSHPSPQLLA